MHVHIGFYIASIALTSMYRMLEHLSLLFLTQLEIEAYFGSNKTLHMKVCVSVKLS